MKINEVILTELLDKPFKWIWREKNPRFWASKFPDGDKNVIKVQFELKEIKNKDNETEKAWELDFGKVEKSGDVNKDAVLNTGKSSRTLATVIEITKEFVKNENPETLFFDAETTDMNRSKTYAKILERELPSNYTLDLQSYKFADYEKFVIRRNDSNNKNSNNNNDNDDEEDLDNISFENKDIKKDENQ